MTISHFDRTTISKTGWIPETEWDDLEALRREHERLIALHDATQSPDALRARFAKEDREREKALLAQMSGQDVDLPHATKAHDREEQIADAQMRKRAAGAAVSAHAERVVAFASQERDSLLADLARTRDLAQEEIDRLRAEIDAAERSMLALVPLETWIKRTARGENGVGGLVAARDLKAPEPQKEADLFNILGRPSPAPEGRAA